jgi:aryl-alcohol dehydrogenase
LLGTGRFSAPFAGVHGVGLVGLGSELQLLTVALHDQGRFPFTDLIEYFPPDQVNEDVAASHAGEVVKPVLRLDR